MGTGIIERKTIVDENPTTTHTGLFVRLKCTKGLYDNKNQF